MTNCTRKPAEEYVESYLQGTLAEVEAQEFEEHFFDCPVCLAQVEALQAATHALRNQLRNLPKAPIPWPIRFAAFGAIAALLFLGFLGYRARHQPTQPSVASAPVAPAPNAAPSAPSKPSSPASPTLSSLADLTLPAFQAPNLRGQSGDAHFESGMKAYTGHDCPTAVKSLARVPAADEDSLAARFYSGVCRCMTVTWTPLPKPFAALPMPGTHRNRKRHFTTWRKSPWYTTTPLRRATTWLAPSRCAEILNAAPVLS